MAMQFAMIPNGPARMVLVDLPPHVGSTYHDLARCLKQRFGPDVREPVHKAEFRRRKKTTQRETVWLRVTLLVTQGIPTYFCGCKRGMGVGSVFVWSRLSRCVKTCPIIRSCYTGKEVSRWL